MPNKFHNDMQRDGASRGGDHGPTKPMAGTFTQKPGFPGGLPGKAQPRDRSGGVKKCQTHPKSEGL